MAERSEEGKLLTKVIRRAKELMVCGSMSDEEMAVERVVQLMERVMEPQPEGAYRLRRFADEETVADIATGIAEFVRDCPLDGRKEGESFRDLIARKVLERYVDEAPATVVTHDTSAVLAEAKRLVSEGKFEPAESVPKEANGLNVSAGWRKGTILFSWRREGIGFGELMLSVRDKKMVVDTEGMSLEFCIDVLRQALQEAGVKSRKSVM